MHAILDMILLALATLLTVWFGSAMYVVAIAECKLDPLVYFFSADANARRCARPAAVGSAAPAAARQPQWFVLRQQQAGYCWVESLAANEGYRPTFAQTAGGPFAAEEQALERLNGLRALAACQRD